MLIVMEGIKKGLRVSMFEEATIVIDKETKSTALFFAKDAGITKDSSRKLKACWRRKEERGREGERGGRFLSSGRPGGRIEDGVLLVTCHPFFGVR